MKLLAHRRVAADNNQSIARRLPHVPPFPKSAGMRWFVSVPLLIVCASSASAAAPTATPAKVEFNRDIRPILSDNCFACHGPDPKHAQGRPAARHCATAVRRPIGDEGPAIVPGKPDESELVARITSTDADVTDAAARLEQEADRRSRSTCSAAGSTEGAEYQTHWAYVPPKPRPPAAEADDRAGSRERDRPLHPRPAATRRTARRRPRPTARTLAPPAVAST